MKIRQLICAFSIAYLTLFPTTSNALLVDMGGGLVYDTVLDITWAQPDTTFRDWDDATTFVSGLTLGGMTGWRLPTLSENAMGQPGCAVGAAAPLCLEDELGYMFYNNMSGIVGNPLSAIGDPDLALFPSLGAQRFWTGTQWGVDPDRRWAVNYANGTYYSESIISNDFNQVVWAVHDGNVGAIPIPAAAWFLASSLAGLSLLRWTRS